MIFSHEGMVYGVELVYMVWEKGGIKKARWVNQSGNIHFSGYYSCSEGSRPRAQSLGEKKVEGKNDFFALGDGVGS